MSGYTNSELIRMLLDAEQERDYFASLVGAFLEGVVPAEGASLQHHLFAKWGRKRLEELKVQPAILRTVSE